MLSLKLSFIKLIFMKLLRLHDVVKQYWNHHHWHFPAKLKSVDALSLSVCARVNTRKHTSNVLKFTHINENGYSIYRTKNDIHRTNGSSTKTHKSFLDRLRSMGRKFLKCILTYLYCSKFNEISIHHSDSQ